MVYSIIDIFLIAIYNGKLEVKVGDVLINDLSLEDIVKNKLDYNKPGRNRKSFEFYKVLTSEETVISNFQLQASGGGYLGEFKVYLLVDNKLASRRVLMSRIKGEILEIYKASKF